MVSRKAVIMGLTITVVVLLGAWTVVGALPTRGIETPEYAVVSEHNGYEIRDYAPYIVAEVVVEGSYRGSLYAGFRKVADYIFGNNVKSDSIKMTAPVLQRKGETSEKIPMTAPVLHESVPGKDAYTVAFVMPKSYTMETLPKPNNSEVQLREVPKTRYAVLRFGGYATEGRVKKKTERLIGCLKRDGVEWMNEPIVAQYNPPWTPPFMRRNEISVELSQD